MFLHLFSNQTFFHWLPTFSLHFPDLKFFIYMKNIFDHKISVENSNQKMDGKYWEFAINFRS